MVLMTFRPQGLIPPRRTVRAKHLEQEFDALEGGGAIDADEGIEVKEGRQT
jgi:branched-chain amino acid transport system permease protein